MAANKIEMNKEHFEELAEYLVENQNVEYDPNDVECLEQIIKGSYQYIGEVLGENKNEDEPVTLAMGDDISFTVSYRAGVDESAGNFGIGVMAGDNMKETVNDAAEDAE